MIERGQMQKAAAVQASRARIEGVALCLMDRPQVECPVRHLFTPGIYYREITMPKGAFVIGKCHKTEHLNVIQRGHATVRMGDKVLDIVGPCVIPSAVGVNKVLIIHEEMVWGTIHANPDDERDPDRLEEMFIEPMMTESEVEAALAWERSLKLEENV